MQKFCDTLYAGDKEKMERYLNSGHTWKEYEDGTIDIFAYSEGTCNGPECETCGYFGCWHCNENPPKCKCIKVVSDVGFCQG